METPTLDEIWTKSQKHFEEDSAFQKKVDDNFQEIRLQLKRMDPMIKAFEDKQIVKSVLETETQIWYIRAKRFSVIAGAGITMIYFIKKIFNI